MSKKLTNQGVSMAIGKRNTPNQAKASKRVQVSTIDTLYFCDIFGEGHNNHELKTLVERLEEKLASVRS
jgi:hypothetical protein